jgi:hypothetical protein
VLYRRYLVEKELAADNAAIAQQGSATSLAAALIKLLDGGAATGPALGAGGDEALEVRVDALLGKPVRVGPHLGRAPLAGSLSIALVAALPLLALQLPADAASSSHKVVAECHLAT